MLKKWKVLSEKDVSLTPWFPLLQHSVELPNKKIIDDYFISPVGNCVMVLPVTTRGEIVLVRQYKHGLGEIVVELPAGFQQPGKSIEESAAAELLEETGIKTAIGNLQPIGRMSCNPTKTNQVTHGFLARNLEFNSVQHLDPTEEIELLVVSPENVIRMIAENEIWVGDSVSMIMKAYLLFPDLFRK
jgi:ADP-ribose pyrophosphatase